MPGTTTYRAQLLFEVADAQAGYFTARQALDLGYGYPSQHHHIQQGGWQRVGHGLFRLVAYPVTPHEQLAQLTLWSRNQQGDVQAVVSHDTALHFHGLNDLLPDRVHLTVPPGFRKPSPAGVVLHCASVAADDFRHEHGFRVTAVERTLRDLAETRLDDDLLEHAIGAALRLGEISSEQAGALRRRGWGSR